MKIDSELDSETAKLNSLNSQLSQELDKQKSLELQESKRQQDLADAAKAKQQESQKISSEIQGLQQVMKKQIELETSQEARDK
jgi:hypothetical protein